MLRSEERLDSTPWTKMMHVLVNSRQVPAKKTTSDNETMNEGLVTFDLDRQESDSSKPQQILKQPLRRSCKYPLPDNVPSPRNFGEDFEHGVACSANGDGDGSDCNSCKKHLGGNRRHRPSQSLDAPQLDTIRLGPTLTTSLSFKDPRNISPMPAKLTADDSTGRFAYISLDGRLINAELATSVASIGGKLGDEEARAWEDFAPMQRVLIVAVAAAAAAAAKQRNVKEIDRLLTTVENREKELICLSQELNEICKLNNTNASQLSRDHPEPFSGSPKAPVTQQKLRRSFDGNNVNLQEGWSSTKYVAQPIVESSPDLFSINTSPVSDEERAKEEAKWYVNPLVESSQHSDDIFSTPERCNSLVSACNPAVQGSFEWTVLSSSTGSRETDVSTGLLPLVDSPLTSPTQTTVSTSSFQMVLDDGAVHKDYKPERVSCAAVILDLRRILAVLEKEASMVMTALDSSVKDAKLHVASMHLVIASCWNDCLPKALAALSLSPSEFHSYLINEAQGTSPWNDVSKIEENIVAWRQYLEKNDGAEAVSEGVEGKSPNKFNLSDEEDVTDLVKQLQSKEVEIAYLKKGQKALLEAKNREIEKLKEDLKSRDAEHDKILAAVETTKTASADRLAILEELCREKDSTFSDLKQDIQSLEWEVQKSRAYQSSAVSRGRRYSSSYIPSSSIGHATSQKQRFSDKYAPSSDPGSNSILERMGRFRKEVPSSKGHLPHLNNQRHEDLTDGGKSEHGYDQETSLDYSSPPGSTIGDDCSVNSLVYSETEVESHFGSENCSSGDDLRSKDRLSGTKDSYSLTLRKQKSISSDLRRSVTSSASSVRSFTRTKSSINDTSATSGSKTATGEKSATKPLHRTLTSEIKKVTKNPNSSGSSNFKGFGSVAVDHCRSMSLDMNFKSNILASPETAGGSRHNGSPHCEENSATKRKRWV